MARALVVVVCVVLSGCVVRPGTQPRVAGEATLLTQFMHRGMVQNERGSFQTGGRIDMETKLGGDLSFSAIGNMDLKNDTGDAWFPDGHAGRFTSVELQAWYTRRVGRLFFSAGIAPYLLPNGTEFIATAAGSERGETKELFVSVEAQLRNYVPSFTIHYDFDEAEGFYVETGVARNFPINRRLRAEARVHGSYSDEDHSLWTYGLDESGFADFGASGALFFLWDESTEVRFSMATSTIVDSGLDEWFDLVGIDSDNIWFSLGILWSY